MYKKRKNPKPRKERNPRKKRKPEAYNESRLQEMAAAAQETAKSTEPIPLDDEIRKLKERGWLRKNLVVDPIRFSRGSLVAAVERGQSEQQAASSQSNALAQWRVLSDVAKKAAKSLNNLTKSSKFKIGELQVLCTKQNLETANFSKSSANSVLRDVRREFSRHCDRNPRVDRCRSPGSGKHCRSGKGNGGRRCKTQT